MLSHGVALLYGMAGTGAHDTIVVLRMMQDRQDDAGGHVLQQDSAARAGLLGACLGPGAALPVSPLDTDSSVCASGAVRSLFANEALHEGWLCQGTMVGPFLGGALANPCTNFGPHFPLCHPGGLFVVRYRFWSSCRM